MTNPYADWSYQRFLDAFNVQHGRTHTVTLAAYQQLEILFICDNRKFNPQGPLYLGGHTVHCEPDRAGPS